MSRDPTPQEVIRELNRVKAVFQLRAVKAILTEQPHQSTVKRDPK